MKSWLEDRPYEITPEEQNFARQVIELNRALLGSASAFAVMVDGTHVDTITASECDAARIVEAKILDYRLSAQPGRHAISGQRLNEMALKGIRSELFQRMTKAAKN